MADGEGASLKAGAEAGGEAARAAFGRLWEGYFRRLAAFAATYRGLPAAEREDAVAESLIAAFGALPSYDPSRPLAPWVFGIAARRFADAARASGRSSSLELGPAGEGAFDPPSPEDRELEAARADLAERCRAAIAALPETDRRIAALRFYEGLDSRRIGGILGLPPGTVRWRLASIRARIAREAGEDE